jgi:hypothetical protein
MLSFSLLSPISNTQTPTLLCRFLFIGVMLALSTGIAYAHGTNPGMAAIRLAGDVVYVTATPEIELFSAFDSNADGKISRKELSKQRPDMIRHFSKLLIFSSTDISIEKYLLQDLSLPHAHRNGPEHLRVTLRFKLSQVPKWLDIEWLGGNIHSLSIRAQRMTAGRLAKQRPLGPVVTATLNSQHPKARLFKATTEPKKENRE